jgi:hypothetical protein
MLLATIIAPVLDRESIQRTVQTYFLDCAERDPIRSRLHDSFGSNIAWRTNE